MTRESTATASDERGDGVSDTDTDSLCVAYRHDVHKLFGRNHGSGVEEFAGVPVNEQVPLGADADAALLSRPAGDPEQTVANHASPHRLSLVTGSTPDEADGLGVGDAVAAFEQLVVSSNAERLHAQWVTSSVAAVFNESVFYPYTSLKFHTLLVAALLDNYRAGYDFDDLSLVATPGSPAANNGRGVEAAVGSDCVCPHRTVCWTPALALHVTGDPGDRPATRLGGFPARSFSDVWGRLPEHPVEVDSSRAARVLDAQLRRIRSWSTALQFIEDVTRGFGAVSEWGDLDA
ncbi:hypothetical protein [Halohasta litorea]|uniref:DUF8168 domain-containing protein n=1 Tax=Halohasta litorea TaxID=869891 RepID=A0ABD6D7Q5_9EURY|nr:hypothetical protein [Halohasta litorea]